MADASSEANSNIRELKYGAMRSLPFLSRLQRSIRRFIKNIIDKLTVTRSFRELTKYKSGISCSVPLSIKDLEVIKKQAKNWNIQYSIIEVDTDNKKKDIGFFRLLKDRFDKSAIEEAKYEVVYRTSDAEIMSKIFTQVAEERTKRQLSRDPSQRTDFNKDGIVDEKDLVVGHDKLDMKPEELEENKEYGSVLSKEFKCKNHAVIDISKEDFCKTNIETTVEIQTFSAYVNRNMDNEQVISVIVKQEDLQKYQDLLKDNDIKDYTLLEANFDQNSPALDYTNTVQLKFDNDKDYQDFKHQYKDVTFNAQRLIENDQYKWNVFIEEDKLSKKFENDIKKPSLEKVLEDISKDKDLNMDHDVVDNGMVLNNDMDIEIDMGDK